MLLNADDGLIVCTECGEATDAGEVSRFNLELEDEFPVCFSCHTSLLETGGHTQCECCGAYFTTNHMQANPDNNITEICPYCGEVWCD